MSYTDGPCYYHGLEKALTMNTSGEFCTEPPNLNRPGSHLQIAVLSADLHLLVKRLEKEVREGGAKGEAIAGDLHDLRVRAENLFFRIGQSPSSTPS
jgi:hypothetical protein